MEKKGKVKVGVDGYQMCEVGETKSIGPYAMSYNHTAKKSQDATSTTKNQVSAVILFGVPIVSLVMDGKERLCLAQISSTLLKEFSYNEIHNRRVALGITCIQCTPVQLEILRRAGAMPVTSRRCGMITRREAERLCQSFLGDHAPPQLPENFAFDVYHECAWGCRGNFVPSRYNSSRAKCIRCSFCQLFFSPNKFIFHSHRLPESRYVQPDAANFNSWRRHLRLCGDPPEDVSSSLSPSSSLKHNSSSSGDSHANTISKHSLSPAKIISSSSTDCETVVASAQIVHAWEDVKAMFNGGTRKRLLAAHSTSPSSHSSPKRSPPPAKLSPPGPFVRGGSPQGQRVTPERSSGRPAPVQLQNHSVRPNSESSVGPPGISAFVAPGSPPFLNPGRIWNPGVSGSNATASDKGRCHLDGNQFHSLPIGIHPLSIPWLRRPPFAFGGPGHGPYDPNCKYFPGEASIFPEFVPGSTNNRSSSTSAFKPIRQQAAPATTAEHLFSTWFNTSALHGNFMQVPEDLSLNSGNSSTPYYIQPSSRVVDPKVTSKVKMTADTFGIHQLIDDADSKKVTQIDSSSSNNSDDDETVDVESTDSEHKGDLVTSSNKVHSPNITSAVKRSLSPIESDDNTVDIEVSETVSSSNVTKRYSSGNNQSNGLRHFQKKKKKRLWDFGESLRCTTSSSPQ